MTERNIDGTYDTTATNGTVNNGTYDYDRYYGKVVVDSNGEKVGDVGQVYLDDATSRPEWVTVRTGLFGTKETFVPLQNESFEGDQIRVPYTKDQIKGAPSIDPNGHISESEEDELYRYYSLGTDRVATDRVADDRYTTTGTNDAALAGTAAGTTALAGDVNRDATYDRTTDANYDRTADVANTGTDRVDNLQDGEVIRREERLNVGKEQVESGRVRIRKHVVNEQQSVSVPVTHEELRVERTPLDGQAVTGGQLSEGETEVVLHEERPVVSKETVGVEKVSVGTEQVTENRTVTENVAKEQVDVVQDGVRGDQYTDGVRGTDYVEGTRTGEYTDGVRDRDYVEGDNRSFVDKVKDKLDRDGDGRIG